MRLCPKCQKPLKETLTQQNVMIDVCSVCEGVWLDEGEINFLAGDRKKLFPFYSHGLTAPTETQLKCPRCAVNLFTGKMPEYGFAVETCARCKGIFLDELELNLLSSGGLRPEPRKKPSAIPAYLAVNAFTTKLPALPSLGAASLGALSLIYSLLFGVLLALSHFGKIQELAIAPIILSVVFLQFLLGPWFTDISLQWLGSLDWRRIEALPAPLQKFIVATCQKNKLPLPSIGIIADDAPNAFTYGRTPKSARLVLTQGILDNLNEDEINSVVGHELGHIAHWDFVVMTMAQLVPLILYEIYRFCQSIAKSKKSGSSKNDPRAAFAAIAVATYAAYLISHYTVMYLSRVREYWADRFGAEAVGNPNHLSSALVKIGYGLSYGPNSREKYGTTSALGIFDPQSAAALALYAGEKKDLSSAIAQDAMQWDLWNPWATYYEVHSTHPLIAKRINALGVQAKVMGIEPAIVFDLKKPESYWDDFLVDLLMMCLPAIGAAIGSWAAMAHHGRFGLILMGFGIGYLIQLFYSYPPIDGMQYSVAALLKKIKVSGVRGIPVKIQGLVIGRGDPGQILSEDFYLRDKTGLIFLDYNQPLGFLNFLFGVFRRGRYDREEVEVTGWYRRSPVPYIEIYSISAGPSLNSTCFTYTAKQIIGMASLILGVIWALKFK